MTAAPNTQPESRLGERIKHARDELSLSVEALSRYTKRFDPPEHTGIPASTLLRYEKSDTYPSAREMRILCQALNVPSRWLLFGELENQGKDEQEQALLMALDNYVRVKAHEIRMASGKALREVFDPYSDAARAAWLEEARKPGK